MANNEKNAQPADVLAVMDDAAHALHTTASAPERIALLEARVAVAGLVEVHAALLAEYGPNICSMRVDAPRRALWLRASAALARVQGGAA